MTDTHDPDHTLGREHPDDWYCPATSRARHDGRCRNRAGKGTQHLGYGTCSAHGGRGSMSNAVRHQMAADAVRTLGLPVDVDPATALLNEVKRAAGAVAWLDEKVRDLDPDELVWGRTEERVKETLDGPEHTHTDRAQLSVWVQLWQAERRALVDACRHALAAGVAERQVRLAEEQGEIAGQLIRAVIAGLDLTPEKERDAYALARQHLALVRADNPA